MITGVLVYYCGWITCAKHFDTLAMLPARCPWCGREGWWELEPPPFDYCLTVADRAWLKVQHIGSRDVVTETS